MATRKARPSRTMPDATDVARLARGDAYSWRRTALRTLVVLTILSISVWLIYGRGIRAPMIFDDGNSIVHNPSIKRLWPLFGTADAPGPLMPEKDFCTSGRPLPNLSLALNYHFSQRFDATGYHVFNTWLHIANALLLWAIVRRTLRLDFFAGRFETVAEPLALLVSLLWAAHPLNIDAVQYITQRTELMMGFFYLGTLLASMHYWSATSASSRGGWVLLAAMSCVAGAACKEVMVSAPAMILLFERTFIAGSFRRALRDSWPLYAGLLCGWGMILLLNIGGPRSESAGFGAGIPAHVWWFTEAKVLIYYLRLALWPWPLVIHYEFPRLETVGAAWPWLLAVSLSAALTLALVWRRTAAGFVLTWVVAILSPTLVVPVITEIAAERRMYLPLAALVALAVGGVYVVLERRLVRRWSASRAAPVDRRPMFIVGAAGLLLALIYGALDAKRVAMFNDPLLIWQDALVHQPGSAISQFSVGITLTSLGRPQEAIPHFEEAVQLRPNDGGTHNNYGFALMLVGRAPEALPHIEKAIRLKPDSAAAQNNMGLVLSSLGRPGEALPHFQRALELEPQYADAAVNLGTLLGRAGQAQAAVDQLRKALSWAPDHLEAFAPLMTNYMDLGQTAEATATARRAVIVARDQGRTDLADQFTGWLQEHDKVGNQK